jgi:hypothetical protein
MFLTGDIRASANIQDLKFSANKREHAERPHGTSRNVADLDQALPAFFAFLDHKSCKFKLCARHIKILNATKEAKERL